VSEKQVPEGRQERDIRDVVPDEARQPVITFMETILREAKSARGVQGVISQRAKEVLEPYKEQFAAREVVTNFFAYWLENAFNQGQLELACETLKLKPKPKKKTLGEIMPKECIQKLKAFLENCRKGTLIIEPGKMVVTMLCERVLEPYAEALAANGVVDLHYFAVTLCVRFQIDPN
jgi:hypothetical protein